MKSTMQKIEIPEEIRNSVAVGGALMHRTRRTVYFLSHDKKHPRYFNGSTVNPKDDPVSANHPHHTIAVAWSMIEPMRNTEESGIVWTE